MPSIITDSNTPVSPGYLSPRVGDGAPNSGGTPALSTDDQQALTQKLFNTTYNENRGVGWLEGTAKTWTGTGIDLADTVASSIYGVTPVGAAQTLLGQPALVQRGDLWDLTGRYG